MAWTTCARSAKRPKYLPARDRYKIYIVDEVQHALRGGVQRAAQTLEEPPGHIKFCSRPPIRRSCRPPSLSRVQRTTSSGAAGKDRRPVREIAQAENVQASDGALALVARQRRAHARRPSLLDQLFSAHDPPPARSPTKEAAETLGALDTSVVREIVAAVLAAIPRRALGRGARLRAGADMKRLAGRAGRARAQSGLASARGREAGPSRPRGPGARAGASGHDSAQLARVFELLQLAQTSGEGREPPPRAGGRPAARRASRSAGSLPELVAKSTALMGGSRPKVALDRAAKAAARLGRPRPHSDAAPLRATASPRRPSGNRRPIGTPIPTRNRSRSGHPSDSHARWRLLIESVARRRKAGVRRGAGACRSAEIDRSGVQIASAKERAGGHRAGSAWRGGSGVREGAGVPGAAAPDRAGPPRTIGAEQSRKQRAVASESRIALPASTRRCGRRWKSWAARSRTSAIWERS